MQLSSVASEVMDKKFCRNKINKVFECFKDIIRFQKTETFGTQAHHRLTEKLAIEFASYTFAVV